MNIDKKTMAIFRKNGGGGEPAEYLKSIEKDEINKKVTITDKQGNETEIPYGSSEPSMQYRENKPFSGVDLGIEGELFNLAYANGIYLLTVATDLLNQKLYKSTDKVNWTEITKPEWLNVYYRGLKGLNDKFIFVDCTFTGDSRVRYSDDGEIWNESILESPSGGIILDVEPRTVEYVNGKYTFICKDEDVSQNFVCTSQDLVNWDIREVESEPAPEGSLLMDFYVDRSTSGDGMYVGLSYEFEGYPAIIHSYGDGLYFRWFTYPFSSDGYANIAYANHKLYILYDSTIEIIPYDVTTQAFDTSSVISGSISNSDEFQPFAKDGKVLINFWDSGANIAYINDDASLDVLLQHGSGDIRETNFVENENGTVSVAIGDKFYEAKFGGIFQDEVNITDKIKELLQ